MSTAPKTTYQKKTVIFAGKELTLFSIDGITWSSRPQELHDIQERHENERSRISEFNRGRMPVKGKGPQPAGKQGVEEAGIEKDAGDREPVEVDDEKTAALPKKGARPLPVTKLAGKAKGPKHAVEVKTPPPAKGGKSLPGQKGVTKEKTSQAKVAPAKGGASKTPPAKAAAGQKKGSPKTVTLKQPATTKKAKADTNDEPLPGKVRAAGGKRR